MKIALVYHNDPDGLMCGFLFSKIFKNEIKNKEAELIVYNYEDLNSEQSNFLQIEENGKLKFDQFIFADITPPIKWLEIHYRKIISGELTIAIHDHHFQKYKEISDLNIISESNYNFSDKISACQLLLNHYFPYLESEIIPSTYMRKLVTISIFIGDYDTWKFTEEFYNTNLYHLESESSKKMILEFNTFLFQFTNSEKFSQVINNLLYSEDFTFALNKQCRIGEILINQQKKENEVKINQGVEFTINNIEKSFIFNGYPDYFVGEELKFKIKDLKYWIGYNIDLTKNQVSFSIRSSSNFDCDKIASRCGGGGHQQSARFTTNLKDGFKILMNPNII